MKNGFIKNNVQGTIKYFISIVFIAVIYLLLCSGYTSPLFPGMMNYDSGIFMMVGKGILEGKELYTEIFDHKGPILFWIEALGMLGGRNGIFIIQTVFMSVNLYLVDRIAKIWKRTEKEIWVIRIATLIVLAYPLSNGNLSEEYSLPFIYLPLYLFFKDWFDGKQPKKLHSYLYGICFGILAFVRINNGITICAIVACWIVILMGNKKWNELIGHLLVGAAGIFTIAFPIMLYFGIKGTFYDMIYATFLFNVKYSAKMNFLSNFSSKSTIAHMVILFSPLLFSGLLFIVKCKKDVLLALEFILLANILTLFLGYGYNHYFTTAIPIITVMLCVLWDKNERIQSPLSSIAVKYGSIIMILGYFILLIRIVAVNVNDYYVEKWVLKEYEIVEKSIGIIPEEEKDSVLGIDVFAKYYLIGNVLPCYRYGILQKHWSNSDPSIMEKMLEFIETESPIWLMVQPEYGVEEVERILTDKYNEVLKNQYIEIYRIKEE